MAGHSHWAGIKHKKAANDAKRGKVWSKIARMIIVAAKDGGGDPGQNLALRYAIDKAKAANMPKDTIEKAIKKGTGELGAVEYVDVLYEGYAPGGVAIMVEGLTDNRNRTAPEIKKIFEKRGGSMGASGCVSYMFKKKGLITVKTDAADEELLMDIALTAGADDFENIDEVYEITCEPEAYDGLKAVLEEKQIPLETSDLSRIPDSTIPVADADTARKLLNLLEDFEDHDDVQEVYANFDIPEDILTHLQ
ncbi:MAG: YebC/PmpR family DNA-binding transcriptional regulator [Planctomycetota bacterium]|nr:MAG: YebC/PmpR family DNA-binding transcriptional regulator [Planctomycetota bacterium]RKY13295.1 MAG: YebC/PmpR family DNA-binding transcriptional regulator [Planctomycetota bacterium]